MAIRYIVLGALHKLLELRLLQSVGVYLLEGAEDPATGSVDVAEEEQGLDLV